MGLEVSIKQNVIKDTEAYYTLMSPLHPTESGNILLEDRCIPNGSEELFRNTWGYMICS
jgi:hypothetical protein